MKRLSFILLLSSMAFGQGVIVPTQQALKVVNGVMSPVSNATITVCAANTSGIPCSPVLVSALFKDAALTQPLTNPFTSDANGNYVFAIAPGNYTVTVTAATFVGYSYQTTAPLAGTGNNTFTGTATFTGAANLNGGGALSGTFSGPTTLSGVSKVCNNSGVLLVDSGNSCALAGTDFGAWINSACTALNAGGKIVVDGGTKNFTTPIVCTPTVNPITIEGPNEENSIWNYTPTTGIAVTFAGSNGNNGGSGIRNVTIKGAGSGNATVGLHLGTNTLGQSGGYFPAVTIRGFGTGLEFNATGGTAFLNSFVSAKIQFNGTGVKLAGEDNQFFGGLIGNNATGVTDPVAGEASFHGVGFDDNTTNAFNLTTSATAVYCLGCRFENAALGTDQYIAMSAGVFSYHGGQMVDDITTSTTTGFVQQSGGSFIDFGTTLKSGGRTVTQLDNISGTSVAILHPWIQNVAQFPSLFTSSYTGAGVEASSLFGLNQNTAGVTYKASQPGVTLDDSVDSGGAWLIKAVPSLPGNGCSAVAGLDILQTGGQRLNFCTGGISIFGATSGSAGLNAPTTGGVINTLPSVAGTLTVTIASGTATMTTAAIAAGACGTTVTVAAANVATTDTITWAFNAAPGGQNAGLVAWPTSGNVNFAYCSNTAETPAAATINWRVVR